MEMEACITFTSRACNKGHQAYRQYGMPSGPGAEFFFEWAVALSMLDMRIGLLREAMRGGGREGMWRMRCDGNEGLGV